MIQKTRGDVDEVHVGIDCLRTWYLPLNEEQE